MSVCVIASHDCTVTIKLTRIRRSGYIWKLCIVLLMTKNVKQKNVWYVSVQEQCSVLSIAEDLRDSEHLEEINNEN